MVIIDHGFLIFLRWTTKVECNWTGGRFRTT